MNTLQTLDTPAAIIDTARMQNNIEHMQSRAEELGVGFRPHVKTTKCLSIVQAQLAAGAQGITVSTLKEAEQFFSMGITDILYAVGMVPNKLPQAHALIQQGCKLKIIVDNVAAAKAIGEFAKHHETVFEVWIEIDTDDHRSGIKPDSEDLLEVANTLAGSGMHLGGVMTHAGGSYDCESHAALVAVAEMERAGAVLAAKRLRDAGLPCPIVSVGSTPTALTAANLEGVSELRAGVYVFHDLVMLNLGVCRQEDIAMSVLTTVIGHQREKGWIVVDAGWMAMSRDRGTQLQKQDFGYGQVCTEHGAALEGLIMTAANQEHGILSYSDHREMDLIKQFPVGTRLRILPNHACATAAQFPAYQAMGQDGELESWDRFYGW